MYIKREDALKSICEYCSEKEMCADANVHCAEYADIKAIPAADVAPVRHGKWIEDSDEDEETESAWNCSECHHTFWFYEPLLYQYCPNCGAKME